MNNIDRYGNNESVSNSVEVMSVSETDIIATSTSMECYRSYYRQTS